MPAPRAHAGSAKSTPVAPVLDASGKKAKDVTLEEAVFGAELKPHLVHETVRAELNAQRSGTHSVKSRGLVAGGRSKPWRQKGTGRARQGTTRAPHWTGGGAAFQPRTNFEVKVNKKERRAALRSALSDHAKNGTLAVIGDETFTEPSTQAAVALLETWAKYRPILVVVTPEQEALYKSFRNVDKVLVTVPGELEVAEIVWARSLLVSEAALPLVQGRAG